MTCVQLHVFDTHIFIHTINIIHSDIIYRPIYIHYLPLYRPIYIYTYLYSIISAGVGLCLNDKLYLIHMIIKLKRLGPAPDSLLAPINYNYYRNYIIAVIHGPNSLFSIGAEVSRGLARGLWAEASVGRRLRYKPHRTENNFI